MILCNLIPPANDVSDLNNNVDMTTHNSFQDITDDDTVNPNEGIIPDLNSAIFDTHNEYWLPEDLKTFNADKNDFFYIFLFRGFYSK